MPANVLLGDVYNLGGLEALDPAALQQLARSNPALALYVDGDPGPLIQATIGNPRSSQQTIDTLYDARRWPDMFTASQPFTDRIFPSLLENASIGYLGGFCRRNKYNPVPAVSWEGFSTEYAALVLRNRRDSIKLLVYSFASKPLAGRMRVWALAHGQYRLTVGPDANGDFQADRIETEESLELARADAVPLTIQPGVVTVVTLEQQRRFDSIFARADLAIAPREVELRAGVLSGTVHNLGSADVNDVVVTVMAENGQAVLRKSLGRLAAPLDLIPGRIEFRLQLPEQVGWASAHAASLDLYAHRPHGLKPILRVVVDPDQQVPEIYEGNNEARFGVPVAWASSP